MTHIIILTSHFTLAVKSKKTPAHPTSWILSLELPFRRVHGPASVVEQLWPVILLLVNMTVHRRCQPAMRFIQGPSSRQFCHWKSQNKLAGESEISLGVHVAADYSWWVSWAQGLTSTVWHGQLIQMRSIQGPCENIFLFKKINQGMTLRDGMGRDVGRMFKMGNTCTPMADSCECMAKTTTIL